MNPNPLHQFVVLETEDVALASAALIDTYGARSFEVRSRDAFKVKAGFVRVGGIALSYCDYASKVELSFPEAGFVRQHICLAGKARIHRGGITEEITPGKWSAIVPSELPVNYSYSADTRQLVMWLDAVQLRRKLSALTGNASDQTIRFATEGTNICAAAESMRRAVEFFVAEIDAMGNDPRISASLSEIEDFVMVRFLYAHDHDHILQLFQEAKHASSRQMQLLEDYIREHCHAPLDVETMANVSGVSARSVFRHFRSAHGCSPQAYRKRIRLDQAKRHLLNGESGVTVIGVALSCGFQSLGHFARDYRIAFGELPSTTLARSPRR